MSYKDGLMETEQNKQKIRVRNGKLIFSSRVKLNFLKIQHASGLRFLHYQPAVRNYTTE